MQQDVSVADLAADWSVDGDVQFPVVSVIQKDSLEPLGKRTSHEIPHCLAEREPLMLSQNEERVSIESINEIV